MRRRKFVESWAALVRGDLVIHAMHKQYADGTYPRRCGVVLDPDPAVARMWFEHKGHSMYGYPIGSGRHNAFVLVETPTADQLVFRARALAFDAEEQARAAVWSTLRRGDLIATKTLPANPLWFQFEHNKTTPSRVGVVLDPTTALVQFPNRNAEQYDMRSRVFRVETPTADQLAWRDSVLADVRSMGRAESEPIEAQRWTQPHAQRAEVDSQGLEPAAPRTAAEDRS